MRRVVITGAGTINPLGEGVAETFAAFRAGLSGIGRLEIRDAARLQNPIGGQVRGYDEAGRFSRAELALYDRFTQFALIAAREAVEQSGLVLDAESGPRAGVILGTSGGGHGTAGEAYRQVYEEGKSRVHPFTVPRLMANAAASHISMTYGAKGPAYTISSACASSNHAMGLALDTIRAGRADVVLTGGSEAMVNFGGLKAWEGLRVMARDTCRPFSLGRTGMVQGEGAAVLVFEALERAEARGAPILAEVAGWGMASDAGDIVLPSAEGACRAMDLALADGGLKPETIGYINAHGTGTAANDRTEAAAIRETFGDTPPPVSSTKSMHGHLMGATGAVELLACLMALREGWLAPTINFQAPDPDCALDVVPNRARAAEVSATLSNAFAFGGLNATIALKRP